ncbi:MAG: histidine kinase, partial [Bacteroidota bacterium]
KAKLALLAGFYLFFAFFYMVILYLQEPPLTRSPFWSWKVVYLDYPLKALFSLPIWWLLFGRLKHIRLEWRIGLTILLLPCYTLVWQTVYYWIVDQYLGGRRMEGSNIWWDRYVTSLFYCIQFGIFYASEHYRKMRDTERAKAESDRLALSSELNALKAQLNPHFLYNAFNAISASVPADQEETRELIAELSDMFRYQLNAAREDVVSLGEELDFVADYLTIEKARFGDRLAVQMLVPKELRRAAIPPLILQPLVENAVRHGISPQVNGGVVTIATEEDQGNLYLRVADTGVGINLDEVQKKKGFGLANTRRRLQLLYNRDLKISRPPEGGTLLEFEIPLSYVTKSNPD